MSMSRPPATKTNAFGGGYGAYKDGELKSGVREPFVKPLEIVVSSVGASVTDLEWWMTAFSTLIWVASCQHQSGAGGRMSAGETIPLAHPPRS